MEMIRFKKQRIWLACIVIALLACSFSIYFAYAEPQGAAITFNDSGSGYTTAAQSRTDPGGQITTLRLNLEQQNYAWKGYVGNVTGSYVLKNSNNFSIYEWPLGEAITGEVYFSRNASINWTPAAISCANNDNLLNEQAYLGMSNTATDNINNTFNSTVHSAFKVGTKDISNCRAIALWVNDTWQAAGASALFQEIALSDNNSVLYVSLINNDKTGFDNSTIFDFQAIVPENRTSSAGTTYYFYVELGN